MENENLLEDVQPVAAETEQPPQEETIITEPPQITQPPEVIEQPKQKTPQESFRELRAKVERERSERERLEKEKAELLKQIRNQQPPQEEEEDLEVNLNPTDLAEGQHLSKMQKQIKKLRQELNNYKTQATINSHEVRIKSEIHDFDKVVTKENLEILNEMEPELAYSIKMNNDLYAQAKSAYKLIKQFGIYTEETMTKEHEKAQKNLAKPRPLNSIKPQEGSSPLSNANAFAQGLTDELKEQLRKEMFEARKNY
jgi:hypothetical protein